jgi:hypothetical protein
MSISINISLDANVEMTTEEADDPSTIYSSLPVCEPRQVDSVAKLPYFPSYSGMNPEQRWLYLSWLCDTTAPIDIGYVFVYYYGLERHLVLGEFDAAVDEILDLRKHHNHPSLEAYSASALVHACLIRKRPDKLQQLYGSPRFDYFDNSNLLILHHSGADIPSQGMFRLAGRLQGVNRRYLRANPDLYRAVISETLHKLFGKDEYPLANRFPLKDVPGISYALFGNISLPNNIRTPALPNLLRHAPFQEEIGGFFREVHETVKIRIKETRPKRSATRKRIEKSDA